MKHEFGCMCPECLETRFNERHAECDCLRCRRARSFDDNMRRIYTDPGPISSLGGLSEAIKEVWREALGGPTDEPVQGVRTAPSFIEGRAAFSTLDDLIGKETY